MPIPTKKTKELPKTAKERVYQELRQWIVEGTLQPGEKISDQEIAQYFSVSRTPVREAIQLLADQKLVQVFPGKETRVSEVDLAGAEATYRLMAELNVLALEFAAPKINAEVIAELHQINLGILHAEDISTANEGDQRFHEVFVKLADNHFLTEFTGILRCHVDRIEHLYYRALASCSYASHEEILAALEQHDLPRAKEAMRRNWLQTLTRLHEEERTENDLNL